MITKVEEKFSGYFEKWVCQLEEYLKLLLNASNSEEHHSHEAEHANEHQALVEKLTAHHKDYYTTKWAAAHEDVLAFFSPVWLSPLENAYLWITGWKPSMAFRLVHSLRQTRLHGVSLTNLSEEQLKKIETLRGKIRAEEEKVEREMERQQMAMADRKIVDLARLTNRVKRIDSVATQVDGLVEGAVKGLLNGQERVMKMADCVRLKTLKGVLDVLSPMQCVDFLSAKSMLQIQFRKWEKNKKKEEEDHSRTASDEEKFAE